MSRLADTAVERMLNPDMTTAIAFLLAVCIWGVALLTILYINYERIETRAELVRTETWVVVIDTEPEVNTAHWIPPVTFASKG